MSDDKAPKGVGWDEFAAPKDTWAAERFVTIKQPAPSDWTAHLCGGTCQFTPCKGQEPNAFHRMMQRLAFGVVWKRRAQ